MEVHDGRLLTNGVFPASLPWLLLILFVSGLFLVFHYLLPPLTHFSITLVRRGLGTLLRTPVVGRWIVSRREWASPWKAYFPVAAVLLAGALLTFWAGDLFLDLVQLLHSSSETLRTVDTTAHRWAKEYRSAPASRFFTLFTIAGGPVGLAVIASLVAILLAAGGRFRWIGYLLVTSVGGGLLNLALKAHFARARPDLSVALRHARGFSFPSGHAMGSMIVAFALAYIGFRAFLKWNARSAVFAAATTFVLLVGLSRIYLGVHWLSDIGAGFAAGAIWVTFTTVAYEAVRRIRGVRKVVASKIDGPV